MHSDGRRAWNFVTDQKNASTGLSVGCCRPSTPSLGPRAASISAQRGARTPRPRYQLIKMKHSTTTIRIKVHVFSISGKSNLRSNGPGQRPSGPMLELSGPNFRSQFDKLTATNSKCSVDVGNQCCQKCVLVCPWYDAT